MGAGVIVIDQASPVFTKIADGMKPAYVKGLLRAGEMVASEIKRNIGDTFGGKGNRLTGALRRSFKVSLVQSPDGDVAAGVFSELPYAAIQNRGGRITAKGAALTVPVGPGKNLPVGTRARDLDLDFIPRKGKPPLLAKTENGKLTAYYVLVKSVYIKPTWYIDDAAEDSQEAVREILDEAIRDNIAKADS